jgi:(p)ppGpp synthase/HD superfamily hydrolase
LEDHPETVTPDDLRRRFGDKVARIVGACSDTPPDYRGGPKPPWRERKTQYMQHLRREGSAFALVALADKLHSARAIVADHAQIGDQLWSRFSAGKEDQLWYFRELVGVFREVGVPNGMLEEFQRAVDKLERSARPA